MYGVMHKNGINYVRCRDGVYYFVRRVPSDLRDVYSSDRISLSLKTKALSSAARIARSIGQRLEDYWLSLRLSDSPIPAEHMLMKNTSHVGVGITQSNAPTLNDALALYLRLKSEGKSVLINPLIRLMNFTNLTR